MTHPFLQLADRRVLVLDGAMGTSIHKYNPTEADWGGREQLNNCDYVAETHPEWIAEIHRGFFAAGCDAVETNTFNGSKLVMAEFGLAEQTYDLNVKNVRIARKVADEFSTQSRPRFVVGSVGPGTKQPSLLDPAITITFDQMYASYEPQMLGLIDGGCDAILIETCFDVLQTKIAVICALDAMRKRGVKLPLMTQVTILEQGKMMAGTDMATAIATLETFSEIDVIGINCALGPKDMVGHVRELSNRCKRKISCLPNAGLPEMLDGKAFFPLSPDELASWLVRFVEEFGVDIVGGCCGTTNEHLAAVVKAMEGVERKRRDPQSEPVVTALHGSAFLNQEPRPLLVGERTNTNGSRKFKQLLEKDDWDGLVGMAREQEREGCHVIDVCTAFVGRDEVRDMTHVLRRFNEILTKPIMIDSTEVEVIEASLKLISGKSIINSVNLEEGRHKFDKIVALARRYGAALVCGCIDEVGMARTADHKFRVAQRIYEICTTEYGIPAHDLLFDPLVLPVSTGQEEERRNGLETVEGIRLIKQNLPGALTIVGLSNVSFGLSPYTRQVVNSAFLHYCLEGGLDSAILHASKIMPMARIDETGRELARRLIFADTSDGDPLQQIIAHYADKKVDASAKESLGDTVDERLKQAIIQGRRDSLIDDLELARQTRDPVDVINTVLLDAMKVVGDLFGSGQMQLPFVLQSAEVMKSAVAHLEKFMTKVEGSEKGKIVLATVKGDVHDIGKNLVDIILTNNGYKVYNIGIKQPVENMIAAYRQHNADAIGMSGLLVKSTVIMKEDLLTLNEQGIEVPVILGGAALTRKYVEHDLTQLYKGRLFYGEDAFSGLNIMDKLCAPGARLASGTRGPAPRIPKPATRTDVIHSNENGSLDKHDSPGCCALHDALRAAENVRTDRTVAVKLLEAPPIPPFWGSRVREDFDLDTLLRFINKRTLFSTQWQFTKAKQNPREYERQMREIAEPNYARLVELVRRENIFHPKAVYGFFPAARDGNEVVIYHDDRRTERTRFAFPRQEFADRVCLSDYFREAEDGVAVDSVSLFAVTMGEEVSIKTKELFENDQYRDYLFLHGLGVEAAEALAEHFHQELRREWGIGGDDSPMIPKLFKKHYRGCRYAFGYPACPNLEDQTKLFELLEPGRIGLSLTEQFLLDPEQSTTAFVVHHPQAKYFNVSRVAVG